MTSPLPPSGLLIAPGTRSRSEKVAVGDTWTGPNGEQVDVTVAGVLITVEQDGDPVVKMFMPTLVARQFSLSILDHCENPS